MKELEFCKCEKPNRGEWWQRVCVCYKDFKTGETTTYPQGICRTCDKVIPNEAIIAHKGEIIR